MGQSCSTPTKELREQEVKEEEKVAWTAAGGKIEISVLNLLTEEEKVVLVQPTKPMLIALADELQIWEKRVHRVIYAGMDIDNREDSFSMHGIEEDGARVSLAVSTWGEVSSTWQQGWAKLEQLALKEMCTMSRGRSWARPWRTDRIPNVRGINLDGEGRVVEIDLHDNNLHGHLTEALVVLPRLEVLYLVQNKLSGVLPHDFALLMNLRDLSLSHNQLSGLLPASYASLPHLEHLNLGWNRLEGSIPQEWDAGFPALKRLDLSSNRLTGDVVIFQRALDLQVVALQGNAFNAESVRAAAAAMARLGREVAC